MTQILSVQSAFPPHQYPQAELTDAYARLLGLRPAQRALLDRLHRNCGVETRHTVLPLAEYGTLGGLAATNDRYITEATALGERALRGALDAAGASASDIDLLMVTSVTGVAVPSVDARLIARLGLRPDVKRLPVYGLGCVAGAAGLARVHDYLRGWPGHVAALLAVELCTLTVPMAGAMTADMVVSGLFADGAAAVIATGSPRAAAPAAAAPAAAALGGTALGGTAPGAGPSGAGSPRLPRVIATQSAVYPDSERALGWRLADDGFRIELTTELSAVVERELATSVSAFLTGHGLTIDDIGTWICHPGGPKVLDAARDSLKLPESAMAASRRSLAEDGNLSSASVLCILERVVALSAPPSAGSFGLMIGLGPGVSAELVLLRW
ncbi:MAG TPA: 3-oxoacyl-[acyl-carrier-protein] synthase III C-terminal domain-containing protein [Trebonia sp.]|jgi:alkylresorcinol/alkylpyrone synthase|nr:3-oxoacyl-[acyl-carrier-protein] synthase III C-terminal domain-containing protein [Trebonia sp.]